MAPLPRFAPLAGLLVSATLPLAPTGGSAFPVYTVGCVDCHPGFQHRGPLHDLHVGPDRITDECLLCHFATPGDVPYTYQSGATGGQGCRGCHGVDNGTTFGWGTGLRAHHAQFFPELCSGCHTDDPPPSPESTLPVYYGRPDVNVMLPCVTDAALGGEDWDDDGLGLDNDGDQLYELADTDCPPVSVGYSIESSTWGRVKSLYR